MTVKEDGMEQKCPKCVSTDVEFLTFRFDPLPPFAAAGDSGVSGTITYRFRCRACQHFWETTAPRQPD